MSKKWRVYLTCELYEDMVVEAETQEEAEDKAVTQMGFEWSVDACEEEPEND